LVELVETWCDLDKLDHPVSSISGSLDLRIRP
jgi:hypothetical protein